MDNLIYVALSGIHQAEKLQSVMSHNLANASTPGFRAEIPVFDSVDVIGDGLESRVATVEVASRWNDDGGAIMTTGEPLDVAIHGDGWFAVQDADGAEAYTRAGGFRIGAGGLLETYSGRLVVGDGGPISVPEYQEIYIGNDGQISVVPRGQNPNTLVEVDRLKLVNPAPEEIERGADGLFRALDGSPLAADPNVHVASGELESANVNVAEALVQMIEISRHYEQLVKALSAAEDTDSAAASVMEISG